MGMKMTSVPGLKKYRSSDRTHIKLPARLWTKEEREEWERDIEASCKRGYEYIAKGDMRSALSVLIIIEESATFGITTGALLDYRRYFYNQLPNGK